jgi:hypothetical protein
MRKALLLSFVFVGVFFSLSVQAADQDATGRWDYSASAFYNNCGDPDPPGWSGNVMLVQSGDSFILVYSYKTVGGAVNASTYQTDADRYWEGGGYTTETINFTMSSPSSATGNNTWS